MRSYQDIFAALSAKDCRVFHYFKTQNRALWRLEGGSRKPPVLLYPRLSI